MYQSLGIAGVLRAFGLFSILIFVILLYLGHGFTLSELLRKASFSVTITALLSYLIGQTPVFPYLCKLPIVRRFFPPIDGKWEVTLESNWGKVKEMKFKEVASTPSTTKGLVTIKARLFSVNIIFHANSRYSKSKTVCVGIFRDEREATIKLNYIYENETQTPEPTDSPTHNGAARLTIDDDRKDGLTMSGTYWTDRKWTEGMNTAGTITFRRTGGS